MRSSSGSLHKTAELSIFSALITVLAVLGNFVRFGPFPITLALAPIVIGAALNGPRSGAFLGGVFGVVTLIIGLLGWDGGSVMLLFGASPVVLVLMCVGKGVLAGWLAGLVYRAAEKKNALTAVILAGIVCPVANTGTFVAVMLLVYKELLSQWAGGSNVLTYALFGLTGVNFLVELGVNMVLSSGITSVIRYRKKGKI